MPTVTADELYRFMCANAEQIDGEVICRASLWAELGRLGIPKGPTRQRLRVRLVKELEAQGLIKRIHPRSRRLRLINPERERLDRVKKESREKLRKPKLDRMSKSEIAVQGRQDMSADDAIVIHTRDRFQDRMALDAIEILMAPKHGFEHDERATRDRLARLDAYFRSNVLHNKRFVCSSWRDCEASISPGCTFTEGQLSHVGKHFDLVSGDTPVRIVVVGQEVGATGFPRTTLEERYRAIYKGSGMKKRFVSEPGFPQRNPHMKGVTLALRALLDTGSGTDRAGEFLGLPDGPAHVFDCFALVNRLICSAHEPSKKTGKRSSTGRPTRVMFENCERHFIATLEILQPTVVVIQGVSVARRSKRALPVAQAFSKNLYRSQIGGEPVLVCSFSHPSARPPHRWDSPTSPYFQEVVRPTLERASDLAHLQIAP